MTTDQLWLGIGFLGQALFSARFFVQWIASERQRKSVVPRPFWYFSLGGGMTLLAYALHRREPGVFVGVAPVLFVAARNLFFVFLGPAGVAPGAACWKARLAAAGVSDALPRPRVSARR